MQHFSSLFINVCPVCGDYKESLEACDNCESEGFQPFNLERAIEQAESVAELYKLERY